MHIHLPLVPFPEVYIVLLVIEWCFYLNVGITEMNILLHVYQRVR